MRLLLTLAGGALVASACAGGSGRSLAATVDPATRALSASAVALDARLLRMADLRQPDALLIDSVLALPAQTPQALRRRARVALLIGQLQLRSHYTRLAELMRDRDSTVAATAAFALGLARDTSALAPLGQQLMAGRSAVAAEAAWALGRIGEPARTRITTALQGAAKQLAGPRDSLRSADAPATADATADATVAALLVAASGLRPVPVRAVLPFLPSPNAHVAATAAYAVARPRAVGAARALLELHAHPDPRVRLQVAVMADYNATGDSLAGQGRRVLDVLRSDSASSVRVQAVRSLASHLEQRADRDRSLELFRLGMRDSVAAVRVTAAELAGVLLPGDRDAWRDAWMQDTTFMVQRALLSAAAPGNLLADARAAWETHADPWRRVAAVELGARAEQPAGLQRAAWARGDSHEQVRVAGVSALTSVDDPEVRDSLWHYLRDPAPRVRAAALGALARRANAADADTALSLYQRESTPDADPVRQAALRVIASAWNRDSVVFSPQLTERLRLLPAPSDPRRRASVERVTPLRDWQTATPEALPLSYYVSLVTRWNVTLPPVVAPRVILHTARGDIELTLLAHDAPLTVENFVTLARRGWFRDARFHRVIPNFVAQDGDPTGTGSGGPGTTVRDELNRYRYSRGAVGMALSGPDTGGSQYFLTLTPQPHLDGGYTVFAQVTGGLDVMDALLLGDRIVNVSVPAP